MGRGLKIEPFRMTLGGYITLIMEKVRTRSSLELSEVALLLYGTPLKRVSYFTEIEGIGLWNSEEGFPREGRYPQVERLYVEVKAQEWLNIRVGKFITPIGLWNLYHIDVLKWTASDPEVAVSFYPRFTTGLMIYGDLSHGVSYSLFFQENRGISEGLNNFLSRKVRGIDVKVELGKKVLAGLNGGEFELERRGEKLSFLGAYASVDLGRAEIWSEAMYGTEEEPYYSGKEHRIAFYLQGTYRVFKGNYMVARFDYLEDLSEGRGGGYLVLGWNFRPVYYFSLKIESRIGGSGGFYGSVSVLF